MVDLLQFLISGLVIGSIYGLAGIGFTDDAAVITALIALLGANIKGRHRDAAAEALKRLQGD